MPFLKECVAKKYPLRGLTLEDQHNLFRHRLARFAVARAQRPWMPKFILTTWREMVQRAGGGPQRAGDLVQELRRDDPAFAAQLLDETLVQLSEVAELLVDREVDVIRVELVPEGQEPDADPALLDLALARLHTLAGLLHQDDARRAAAFARATRISPSCSRSSRALPASMMSSWPVRAASSLQVAGPCASAATRAPG